MKRTSMYAFVLFIVLMVMWEIVVRMGDIPRLILPGPLMIGANLLENLLNGYFWPHILATLFEVLSGFLIGAILGMGLGFTVAQSPILKEVLQPYIIASQAMPKLALAPLLAVWFGFGYLPKMIIVALISFFPLFESTLTGLSFVDRDKILLFRALRASNMQILFKLRLPTAIPHVFSGLRVAVVLSVVGAVVSEFIGANQGLGALIIAARMDTTLMFSVFILLTMMGMLLYYTIDLLERIFFKKYHHARHR